MAGVPGPGASLGPKRFGPSDMAAWMLENTRRRPALVPAPCPYPPCISRHRPAPVRVIMRRPRGEQPLEGGKGCPPPGHRPRPARASETSRSSPPFAPRPLGTWANRQTNPGCRGGNLQHRNHMHCCACLPMPHSCALTLCTACNTPAVPPRRVAQALCGPVCVCLVCVCMY